MSNGDGEEDLLDDKLYEEELAEDRLKEQQEPQVEGSSVEKAQSQAPRRSSIMADAAIGGTRLEIEKYDGRSDYPLWERQVIAKLWSIGMGITLGKKPADYSTEEWSHLQLRAVHTVELYLKPLVLRQTTEEVTVQALFAQLQRRYNKKALSNRLYTSLKLMSFKMLDGTKIQDHIEAFNDLAVDLVNMGETLTDERKALHLLSSLPASYQSLTRVLLFRNPDTISYNEVVNSLLSDDIQQKLTQSTQPQTSSFRALSVIRGRSAVRFNGQKRPRSKGRSTSKEKKVGACWKCGKLGHMKKDCRSKGDNSSSAQVARAEDVSYAL